VSSIFGPLVGGSTIEAAVLDTLRTWLPTYLWEVERQHNIAKGTLPHPPTPESYHGGVDFSSWQEDTCPEVIVVCNPTGEPERSGSVGYSQAFEIQIAAVVIDAEEDTSRLVAGYYGEALQGALVQQPALGGLAEHTVMTSAPHLELQDPDERRLHQVSAAFQTFIAPIVIDQGGPDVPTPSDSPLYGGTPDAPYGDWPTVTTTQAVVTADPIDEQ
jgi:hypothetical protein